MTKKHFELIARLISEGLARANTSDQYGRECERSALWRFADNFTMEARRDNERFDRLRFLKACGFEAYQYTDQD